MDSIERVRRVLAGQQPDHPPVSFWYHFRPEQFHGRAAVEAHLTHLESYDLDFLKVMNDNPYPHATLVESIDDLAALTVLRGDEPEFARQLDLIADLRRALRGRVLMITTLFNSWATLRHLTRKPTKHLPPQMKAVDAPSARIKEFHARDPQAVSTALERIGRSLANFVRRCLDAGADGVFLSVRDDWIDAPGETTRNYAELVRPSDLEILEAASTADFNMLHVCGRAVDFRAFAEYPVHAINWADRAVGPTIAEVGDWVKPAICAGVDNLTTLANGSPDDCEREVADARRQAGQRPIMIAPGCTFDAEQVPRANLEAVCRAARR